MFFLELIDPSLIDPCVCDKGVQKVAEQYDHNRHPYATGKGGHHSNKQEGYIYLVRIAKLFESKGGILSNSLKKIEV